MTKELKLRVGRKYSNPTLTPHGAESVCNQIKTEMDAKNQAYLFIITCNLVDKFRTFCLEQEGQDVHNTIINQLYTLSTTK